MNIHYMYKLLCIRYKDHHLVLHRAFCYVNSLKVCFPHCSSTLAPSRKQVTNRLYVAVFCLILLPQFSSHLHESCYTRYIWRVNAHDIWFASFGLGVPELCVFLKIKLQFSSHLYDFMVFLWQRWDMGYTHQW